MFDVPYIRGMLVAQVALCHLFEIKIKRYEIEISYNGR